MSGQDKIIYTKEQLDEALFHVVDIMDRCVCSYILLNDTAKSIVEDDKLSGDGISIGVRLLDRTDSVDSTLRSLASAADINVGIKEFSKSGEGYSWVYQGIPINIKLIKSRKYEFINFPTKIWYWGEEYQVPNPFDKYDKVRGLIK